MKAPFKSLLQLCLALMPGTALFAQWESIPLPCRPDIERLQVLQGKVYANTSHGTVFVSANHGVSWQNLHLVAPNFTINPSNDKVFYNIGVLNEIVYLGTIAAQLNSYSNTYAPFAKPYYRSGIAFSNDTVYLFNGSSLARLDNGLTWVQLPMPPGFNIDRAFVFGRHIWASNNQIAVHSPNNGIFWDTIAVDPQARVSLAAAGDTLLLHYFDTLQQRQVLSRTTNQGQTWTKDTNQPNIASVKGGRPFLGYDQNDQHAYYSWNGLTDWQPINTEFVPNTMIVSGGVKIVGQNFGAQYQKNGPWETPSFGIGVPGEMANATVYLRKAGDFLLFGGDEGSYGMYKRAKGDQSWSLAGEPYFADRTVQIGNRLIGCGKHGTYRAELGGPDFKWTLLNQQTGYLFDMNGKLYVCDPTDGIIYRSTDEGQTWTKTGTAPSKEFYTAFAAMAGKFFMRINNDVMVSDNEGQSWTSRYTFSLPFDSDISRLFALNGRLFLSHVTTRQAFSSSDDGLTFTTLSVPQTPTSGPFRLQVNGNQLFFFGGGAKLYRSSDLGQTWKTIKPPYPSGFDFTPSVWNNGMFANDTQIYLFDPSKGAAWVANLNELEPSPCDNIYVTMPPEQCWLNADVVAPSGMQYTWFENGAVIQQSNDSYPQFSQKSGNTYKLVVTHPTGGCSVSDETKIIAPVADVIFTPILPCGQEFAAIDFSKCSHGPGIQYTLRGEFVAYLYENEFDAAGNPSNPNPPVVGPGWYTFRLMDPNSGCEVWDTITIERDWDATIKTIDLIPTACGQNNGVATVQNTGDLGQTTYSWSNGHTTKSISGLAPGWYSVTVTTGFCTKQQNFLIEEDPACKVKIRGKTLVSSSGCLPSGAYGVGGVMLHLLPDDVYTYSDQQGHYEFVRPPGNYTVEFVDPVRFDLLCPAAGSYSVSLPAFGSASEGNDFFVKIKPVKNLSVSVSAGQAVPGFAQQLPVKLCNHGNTVVTNASFVFVHAPELTGLRSNSFAFSAYNPATQTARIDNITIYPQNCFDFVMNVQVPASTPLGTPLHFSADFLPTVGDFTPADNHQEWSQTVVGSFDPNDKQVSPGETERGGRIYEKDTLLRYTIRFQNTGNHPATTVEIRDTLDENLEMTSIQPGATSHPYYLQTRFEGRNVLIFTFNGIHLPDSMASQAMSQGYVSFSIKRKPNLPFGTRIKNRAGIYFDFNAPVITNWVESVLSPPVGTANVFSRFDIRLFPNPNHGQFTVELSAPASAKMLLKISDLAGRVLLEEPIAAGSLLHPIEADALPQGLYFLQVLAGGRVLAVEKFVKQ